MCGITGFVNRAQSARGDTETIESMTEALKHRGPDSSGVWASRGGRVWFGHTRLAVIDLTVSGHQPMLSKSGSLVITFNGEIYNHRELRKRLDSESPVGWQGASDTETLLEALERWGVEQTLQTAEGMFAFACYDLRDGSLTLARDKMGQKPLYYGYQGETFLFGSDLQPLKQHPDFSHKIDRLALTTYFEKGYVPTPLSIFSNIAKLPAGSFLRASRAELERGRPVEVRKYWSYAELFSSKSAKEITSNRGGNLVTVEEAIGRSIRRQLMSDVPIGAFLSGGIDSSLVVAVAQSHSSHPLKTFTIGSSSSALDEADFARQVARVLGTDHTEHRVSTNDALATIADIGSVYSEPFSDSSQIPTLIVSKLTRASVKVALTGDGADEIFGGYNRYLRGLRAWQIAHTIPVATRKTISRITGSPVLYRFGNLIAENRWMTNAISVANIGDKFNKVSKILGADSLENYYRGITEKWVTSPVDVEDSVSRNHFTEFGVKTGVPSDARWLMIADSLAYLPDDILVKVDRAAMAYGLETRAPFLDSEVMEVAASIPEESLLDLRQGKPILRQILGKYLPQNLINRPKIGFGVPIGDWLRGPLRHLVEELLNPRTLQDQGFLKPDVIQREWEGHLDRRGGTDEKLWSVIVFQLWLKENPRAH